MPALLDRIRQTIAQYALASPDTRLVIALSGGSDSVALAYLMGELAAGGELRVAGLAHFNHQLRPTADRDERFCTELAATLGWPLFSEREDVAARAARRRTSIESAARAARYEFFERARTHFAADRVALGHTRDDQAETFLLRLIRGAGPKGLASMHPRHGAVIRPLLFCRRDDLRAFLAAKQVRYVDDETNRDVSIPRNRVRAELLPLLARRFNPSIVGTLADEAELARGDWEWMEQTAVEAAADVVRHDTTRGRWELDVQRLRRMPLALRRMVVRHAMGTASKTHRPSFADVEAVLRLVESDAEPLQLDAPGQHVERAAGTIVLTGGTGARRGRTAAGPSIDPFRVPLPVPGQVLVPATGWRLSAEFNERSSVPPTPGAAVGNGALAIVRGDDGTAGLAVRNRRPGDRFHPPGLAGTKKLQDYFVDRKVPRGARDAVPLVVDAADRIVWVGGYGIDEAFRVTDACRGVIILRLTRK